MITYTGKARIETLTKTGTASLPVDRGLSWPAQLGGTLNSFTFSKNFPICFEGVNLKVGAVALIRLVLKAVDL